jgi:hypothetical protein
MTLRGCYHGYLCGLCLVLGVAGMMAVPSAAAEDAGQLKARLYWDRSVVRAAREERLWLYVQDLSDTRPELSVTLTVPGGMELLDESSRELPAAAWEQRTIHIGGRGGNRSAEELHPSARLEWRVRCAAPLEGEVSVTVTGSGKAVSDVLPARVLAPLALQEMQYLPEPVPAQSDRIVGMIYCPLWKPGDHYGWDLLEGGAPWRKPALGWYDESLPEVTDWEIKWNVEHGVDFLLYCWYRAYGNEGKPVGQMLGHGIHEGLFNAKFQDRIKFAIMWTNTDYSGVASREDLLENLFPFWMGTYFKRPNYLTIDNKPLLAVYDMRRLIKDLGGEEAVRETLDLLRAACVAEGFDGLWITAESRHWWPDYLETMAACGFDASFAYCWNNVPDGATDEQARDTILSNLRGRKEWNLLPDIPTVSAMWDPTPWEQYAQTGRESTHYRMSPESFRLVCQEVKVLNDDLPEDSLARRVVLVDNWNEWGEGHYLSPCREHGFQYLDVLRDVFTDAPREHTDLVPEDLGLGPYDAAHKAWLEEAHKEVSP